MQLWQEFGVTKLVLILQICLIPFFLDLMDHVENIMNLIMQEKKLEHTYIEF